MNSFFPVDRFLSLGVLALLLLENLKYRSSRSSGRRFNLAVYYEANHPLSGLEKFLSHGDFVLLMLFAAFMIVLTRRRLPEQAVYVLGGLGGSVCLLLYQGLKWYWAAKLCDGSVCQPSDKWGWLPMLLPLSALLIGYFSYRASQTRLFHFIPHNRG